MSRASVLGLTFNSQHVPRLVVVPRPQDSKNNSRRCREYVAGALMNLAVYSKRPIHFECKPLGLRVKG